MEVRPGYKQSEVGVIPEHWDVRRIADFATVGSGGTPSRAVGGYWNGSIPWITTSQVDFGTIGEADQFITEEGLKNSAAKLLPVGTLLIALYGQGKTRGKVGVLGIAAATNQACASITLKEGVSREFILHYLASKYEEIRNSSNSGSQENLSGLIVKSLPVAFPELQEQRAIAAALSDMDALLAGLDRLIAKKRDLKQAAMQQLLTGQTRLPGFQGEWEVRRLTDLAEIGSGGTPSTSIPHYWGGSIPWCTPTDITALDGRKYVGATARTITSQGLKSSSAEMIPPLSIVMTSRATIGACAINTVPLTTNQGFKNFVPRPSVNVEFLYYLLQTHTQGFISLCGGSTFLEIGKTQLSMYEVELPGSYDEQLAISDLLSDMDAELTILEARRDKTHALKQAMMQELLTGKTRLA